MGRIPLLLPLDVKHGEGGTQKDPPGARPRALAGGSVKRASFTVGALEFCSPRHPARSREARQSVTDDVKLAPRANSYTRCGDGDLAQSSPLPHPFISETVAGDTVVSPVTGSTSSSHSGTSRLLFGRANSSINIRVQPPHPGSPLLSTHDSIGSGSTAAVPGSAAAALHARIGQRTTPTVAAGTGTGTSAGGSGAGSGGASPGAGAGASRTSQSLSGAALARVALSTCTTAEQQLREMSERGGPPSSPWPPPLPATAFAAQTAPLSPANSMRRRPAPPPALSLSQPLELPLRQAPASPSVASSCSSPDVTPVAGRVLLPVLAFQDPGGSGGKPPAGLPDQRLARAISYPSISRQSSDWQQQTLQPAPQRRETGATPGIAAGVAAGAGAGASAASWRASDLYVSYKRGTSGDDAEVTEAVDGYGKRPEQSSPFNTSGVLDEQGQGQAEGPGQGRGLAQAQAQGQAQGQEQGQGQEEASSKASVSSAADSNDQQHQQHQHREDKRQGQGGTRRLAQLLQSMLAGPPRQQQQQQQEGQAEREGGEGAHGGGSGGQGDASARYASDGYTPSPSSGAPPGMTGGAAATAMRVVGELQSLDEFSLVAAARQRQLLAQQTLATSAHRTAAAAAAAAAGKKGTQGGAASPAAGSSLRGRRSLGDAPYPLQPSRSHNALSLLLNARTSCPELGPLEEPSLALTPLANAIRAAYRGDQDGGGASPPPTPPDGSGGGGGGGRGADECTAAAASGSSGGSGGGASFLPALPSPRAASGSGRGDGAALAATRSNRSFTSLITAGGGGRGGSTAGSSRHAVSEFGSESPVPPTASAVGQQGLSTPAAATAAAAAETEAAVAAVRALAARFGTVDVEARLQDLDDLDAAQMERRKRLFEALQAANPAAYREDAAEAAEAAYRALSERAQLKLRRLLEEPTTQEAPVRQLEGALRELTSQRPFFLPPVLVRPKVERSYIESEHKSAKATSWNVEESIFALRKKESESHDVYDTDKIRSQQLNLDWKRIVAKVRFRRMVARGDAGVKVDGQPLEEELGEVREELARQGDFLRAAFIYYSMLSGGPSMTSTDVHQISASAWLTFCHDAGIIGQRDGHGHAHGASEGCTAMDMQNIFVAVNFEEESETAEAEANDDDAMVRFEFLEGLVRAAFSKYIVTKRMTDASDALGVLLEEVAASPNLPPEVRLDPNEFRRTRLYTPEVEEVVKEYLDLLTAVFKLYKAKDRAKYFWPEHFMAFLEANRLLGYSTGVHRREAKLIFAWSQALVTDELRRRQRAVSLTFWDFVEAVARLADMMSPPDKEEIIQFFLLRGEEPPELDRLSYEYYKAIGDADAALLRRPSAGLMAAPSRPLASKLRLLLEYLVASLREAWGGTDPRDVAAKVARTANYLCGGIEMG